MTSCDLPKAKPAPCSIHVGLHKNEIADHDIHSWPAAVQTIMARELDRWSQRNPELDIVEQNYSIDAVRRICICEFFHHARVPA